MRAPRSVARAVRVSFAVFALSLAALFSVHLPANAQTPPGFDTVPRPHGTVGPTAPAPGLVAPGPAAPPMQLQTPGPAPAAPAAPPPAAAAPAIAPPTATPMVPAGQ